MPGLRVGARVWRAGWRAAGPDSPSASLCCVPFASSVSDLVQTVTSTRCFLQCEAGNISVARLNTNKLENLYLTK